MMQTLAELKAEVELEEQKAPIAENGNQEEQQDEVEATESDESQDIPEEGQETESEGEDWAKPDPKNFVPAKVHSELRKSLRATESEVDVAKRENEELKARLAALENGRSVPQNEPEIKRPKLSDPDIGFDEDVYADRMAQYTEAIVDRKLQSREQRQSSQSQEQQHQEQVQAKVDKHYERAEGLVSRGTVTAENYQAADQRVRQAVSQVLPNGLGDLVLDNLIADLGDGSEKVIYHLGVNPNALAELVTRFKSGKTGFAVAAYLGGLNEKFKAAQPNKLSQAPRPDKALNGSANISSDNPKKAFDKAMKADDMSGMMAARRAAKAKGIDISKW